MISCQFKFSGFELAYYHVIASNKDISYALWEAADCFDQLQLNLIDQGIAPHQIFRV